MYGGNVKETQSNAADEKKKKNFSLWKKRRCLQFGKE